MNNTIGRIVGGIVFAGAVGAIWLWPKAVSRQETAEPIRPVRSAVVKDGARMPDLEFPGIVKAGTDRTLAFEVPGKILSIPVAKNQRVKAGDVIAKLDPKDFADRLAKAKAELDRDTATLARYRKVAANAISQQEISRAEAQQKTSQAVYDSAKRDLDRTVLTAPFDGVVADTFPSELDVVAVGARVAIVLDTREVGVEVSIPETIVIRSKMLAAVNGSNCAWSVVFDSYPGKSFPAEMDEFTAMGDARTQVYKAKFKLANVPELNLLPGMSATVRVSGKDYVYRGSECSGAIAIPSAAIGVDETGACFVWKLEPAADAPGLFEVHKFVVTTGGRVGTDVVVSAGVRPGDRLATAGVSVLSEGRRVTLLKDDAK